MKKFILMLTMLVFGVCLVPSNAMVSSTTTQATSVVNAPKKTTVVKAITKVKRFFKKTWNKIKADDFLIAVLLTFFLGYIGAHRLYMGGSPVLMLGYFALTLCGGLGILLALIDFIRLLVDEDTSRYEGNNKLFAAFID